MVLLDDHDLVRRGFHSLHCHEPDLLVVGEARSWADALSLVGRLHPHIVLLDMQLPDASGMQACRRLLAAAPQLRILILTSHADGTMVAAAIRSGAQGSLPKDSSSDALVRAIKTVALDHACRVGNGRHLPGPRCLAHLCFKLTAA
jgi:DNA-binding NarL/FixJ family response regulator